jgi:hypothetical protein
VPWRKKKQAHEDEVPHAWLDSAMDDATRELLGAGIIIAAGRIKKPRARVQRVRSRVSRIDRNLPHGTGAREPWRSIRVRVRCLPLKPKATMHAHDAPSVTIGDAFDEGLQPALEYLNSLL